MKRYLFLLILAFPALLLAQPDQDDLAVLAEAITLSKKILEEQQCLQALLLDFNQKRGKFLLDPDSARLATQLVKSAQKVEAALGPAHLKALLSDDLLTEIAFFAKVGKS